jgi:flagellar biosynthesis protein FlhB
MKILKKFTPLFILIILALGFLLPAVNCQAGFLASSSGITAQTGALSQSAGFDTSNSIADIVATIIRVVLSLLGIIFLVLLILGGYQWMTAGGNEDQVSKAQDRIKTAIIGLVIVLAAYAITAFVFSNLPFNSGGGTGVIQVD